MGGRDGWRGLVVVLLALVCRLGMAQAGPRHALELPAAAHGAGPGTAAGQLRLPGQGLALIEYQGLRILALAADAEAYGADAVREWPEADAVLLTPPAPGRYGGLMPLAGWAGLVTLPVIVSESALRQAGAVLPSGARARLYPLQLWDALQLRKGKARLRVTAMAGAPGSVEPGGFLLDFGSGRGAYRIYVGCAPLEAGEQAALAARLPGADLALLPNGDTPRVLALARGGPARPLPAGADGYRLTPPRR
ncbi:hypothetical protein ACLB1G_24085 [Oxalobacteraceae bacterium A2-2]